MKRSRLSYDEWTRITSKKLTGKNIDLAICTSEKLQQGLLSDEEKFMEYTMNCYKMIV